MKNFITLYIILFCAFNAIAQNAPDLKFDKSFTQCEKKWVVFERDATHGYPYGLIYVDLNAGFTFDLKGFFTLSADGKFIPDNSVSQKGPVKYRLAPGTKPVALLPADRLKELNLELEPSWLKSYYPEVKDSTDVYYNYRMGWVYNAAGESATAIKYLAKAYSKDSADDKVKFELGFAYNALGRFDEAIKLLEAAVQNNSNNVQLYKELGYAYGGAKKYEKSIETYVKGLALFPSDVRSDVRGEMAVNIAMAYKRFKQNG